MTSTQLCTTITENELSVSTTEHILSALYAMNIDNAIIELDAKEVPVMDGSSHDFVESILDVGTINQNGYKKVIKIKKNVEVRDHEKIVRVSPQIEMLVTCEIGYDSQVIGHQSLSLLIKPEIYKNQISSARTFGFLEDVSNLRKNGLALGGSLDNAVVISDDKVLNEDGLRFNDEFVRHKTLDLIGDLALSGYHILGSVYSYHAGHNLNNKLLRAIFSSDQNWEFVDSY